MIVPSHLPNIMFSFPDVIVNAFNSGISCSTVFLQYNSDCNSCSFSLLLCPLQASTLQPSLYRLTKFIRHFINLFSPISPSRVISRRHHQSRDTAFFSPLLKTEDLNSHFFGRLQMPKAYCHMQSAALDIYIYLSRLSVLEVESSRSFYLISNHSFSFFGSDLLTTSFHNPILKDNLLF